MIRRARRSTACTALGGLLLFALPLSAAESGAPQPIRRPATVIRTADRSRMATAEPTVRPVSQLTAQPAPESLPAPDAKNPPLPAPENLMPPIGVPQRPPEQTAVSPAQGAPLVTLEDVLASVDRHFPLLIAAIEERGIAAGELLSAWGSFDLKATASGVSNPMGFYQYHRTDWQLEQPTWWGGKVYGGYKLGRGFYPLWYGDLETNDGGEFRLGMMAPLWQDRPIDKRRAEIRKAEIIRSRVEPSIQRQRIEFRRAAAVTYWDWVAARNAYDIAKQLLELATARDAALAKRVERGDLARMVRVENQSLIVQRQLRLSAADRKFRQAAIKLSLFWRNPMGFPVLPEAYQAPPKFPAPLLPTAALFEQDLQRAFTRRPELAEIALERQKTAVELAYAQNLLRPTLDAGMKASQDVGGPAKQPKNDKDPFELEGGVYFDVPVQRRFAQGQVRSAQAKLAQLTAKQRYTSDKVQAEVRDSLVALDVAFQQIGQAAQGVHLAREVEQLERRKFELGASNLIFLNLREQASADAATREIEAVAAYFAARAEYRAAVAADVLPPGALEHGVLTGAVLPAGN